MNTSLFRSVLFVLWAVGVLTPMENVHAGMLYGVELFSDRLVTIDPTTGAFTPVGGQHGFVAIDALAFEGSGALYGAAGPFDGRQLVRFNTETGVGTAIGPMGIPTGGIAFDNSTGTLYASRWAPTSAPGALFAVNTSTGQTSFVGNFGFDIRDLEFDDNTGTLYGTAIDRLLTIDTTTGVATTVGPTGAPEFQGLALDNSTGTLYAASIGFRGLYTIDTTTGAATEIAPLGNGGSAIGALAFLNGTAGVPEPSSFALLAMGAVVLLVYGASKRWATHGKQPLAH